MTLTSKKPTIVEGVEYPYLLISFSLSQQNNPSAASVAIRLTPYRELDGKIEKLPEAMKAVSYFDIFKEAKLDQDIDSAINKIMSGVQDFINDKGL